MAPSRALWRSTHRLHQQNGPCRSRLFFLYQKHEEKLGANAVAVQCPIGAEGNFNGMVDLVSMKAYVFKDETMGAEYELMEIPDDLKEQCQDLRSKMLEELATVDESDEILCSKFSKIPTH